MNTKTLRRLVGLVAVLSALAVAVLPPLAGAVSTRVFEIDDAAAFSAGELSQATVSSEGRVTAGAELRRLALPDDVGVVWSWARRADGQLFLGTGPNGKIFRQEDDRLELFAETGEMVVTSLAFGDGGVLYAGTLPEGRILAIEPGGAVRVLVQPPQAEHVWALAWDARRRVLFAATGPEGQVFAVAPDGTADLWWDAPAAHVMSLALAADGTLYAGTSDDALVVRLDGPGRAEVVFDFPGNEITALDARDGVLAVAANEFADPPAVSGGAGTAIKHSASASRTARPRPGKGRVWRVGVDGRVERVWSQEEGHVTSVQLAADGTLFASLGAEGRIVRVAPDRTFSVWIDVDERQVLAMDLRSDAPFFATGDGAAFYRVVPGRPRSAVWQSRVLDAEFASRWGQLTWRGSGRVEFQTRAGGTERPDATWSAWSSSLTEPGPIRSPGARFLQIRALLGDDPTASVRSVSAYYLPRNQRPVVTEVGLKARPLRRGTTPAAAGVAASEAAGEREGPGAPSPMLGLTWKVDNPDADRLRYRLRFREEGQTSWRDVLREHETLTATEYVWNTSSVPDGFYVFEVEASDELSNPAALSLRSQFSSEPLLVDNHAPILSELRAQDGRVTGRALDALGPIARMEFAVDGGEWNVLFPIDDLLDTRDERFEVDVSGEPSGLHVVAVRATDAGGNSVVGEVEVSVAAPPAGTSPPEGRGGRRTGARAR